MNCILFVVVDVVVVIRKNVYIYHNSAFVRFLFIFVSSGHLVVRSFSL